MRTAIVYVSISNGNTRRVAERLALELDAKLFEPEAFDVAALANYDLIGFGSGIYFNSPHQRLLDLVERLPQVDSKPAFLFFTSGMPELPFVGYSGPLTGRLKARGFRVIDTFTCRGLDTVGPLRLIGGINKGHPNEKDLRRAGRFARQLQASCAPP